MLVFEDTEIRAFSVVLAGWKGVDKILQGHPLSVFGST